MNLLDGSNQDFECHTRRCPLKFHAKAVVVPWQLDLIVRLALVLAGFKGLRS